MRKILLLFVHPVRMATELSKAKLEPPEFDTHTASRFKVIFRKNSLVEQRLRELGLSKR